MNRSNLHLLRNMAAALLLCAGFASCSQDDLTGNQQGEPLPPGEYPLEIGSVSLAANVDEQPWSVDAPQTRVSENSDGNSSRWNNNDKIHVLINGGGFTNKELICTLDANGQVTGYSGQLYWKNTKQATINAWYASPETNGTINLSDQTGGLVYVLKGSGKGSYNAPVNLTFTHALAKVRVVLTDDQAVKDVKIRSYTECTHTKGESIKGRTEGWITMKECNYNGRKCWEANVVPEHEITAFQVNGVENTLTTSVTPKAGKWHEITIKVKKSQI